MENTRDTIQETRSLEEEIKRIKDNINFAKPLLKRVHRVVNGDTFIISEDFKVKLLGVKTPRVAGGDGKNEYFSRKSLSFTNRQIMGKRVKLKFDKEKIDKNGRILAYVYLPDSKFLNAEILKQGYGKLDCEFECIYLKQFTEYEKEAKDRDIGLWKKTKPPQPQKKVAPPDKRQLLKSRFNPLKYVASRKTKLIHFWYCPESEKIEKADFVILKTVKDGIEEGYKPCKDCNPK